MSSPLKNIDYLLRTHFGLEPPKVNFELTKENSNYSVRTNTIHINPKQGHISLFHEYAHALFTQQSDIGKENFHKLQELNDLETRLGIRSDEEVDFELTPEIEEYLKLREAFDELYFRIYRPAQEGFALWMEVKLCELTGKSTREAYFSQTEFYPFFNAFKSDELNKGLFSTLYHFGFPFSTNPNHLITFLGENVHKLEDYTFSVVYGSQENDLDILLVGGPKNRGMINQNNLDCLVTSDSYFREKVSLLDIEVIDPLLTGDFFTGNPKEYYKIMDSIPKPSELTIHHAKQMGVVSLRDSSKFIEIGHFPNALGCMSYALSYFLSSKAQAKDKILTFNELKEGNAVLRELVKVSKKQFTLEEAKYVLNNSKKMIQELMIK